MNKHTVAAMKTLMFVAIFACCFAAGCIYPTQAFIVMSVVVALVIIYCVYNLFLL